MHPSNDEFPLWLEANKVLDLTVKVLKCSTGDAKSWLMSVLRSGALRAKASASIEFEDNRRMPPYKKENMKWEVNRQEETSGCELLIKREHFERKPTGARVRSSWNNNKFSWTAPPKGFVRRRSDGMRYYASGNMFVMYNVVFSMDDYRALLRQSCGNVRISRSLKSYHSKNGHLKHDWSVLKDAWLAAERGLFRERYALQETHGSKAAFKEFVYGYFKECGKPVPHDSQIYKAIKPIFDLNDRRVAERGQAS